MSEPKEGKGMHRKSFREKIWGVLGATEILLLGADMGPGGEREAMTTREQVKSQHGLSCVYMRSEANKQHQCSRNAKVGKLRKNSTESNTKGKKASEAVATGSSGISQARREPRCLPHRAQMLRRQPGMRDSVNSQKA